MKSFIQKLMQLMTGILFALPLGGCATTPLTPVHGQVLEEGTNKPIANALVVGLWHGTVSHGFVDARTVCYHVETATADELGRFTLPPTEKEYKYRDGHHYTSIIAYKPGYQSARVQRTKGVTYLQPFTGGRDERLKYLKRIEESTRCNVESEQQKIRYPLVKALYEEARNIAVTKQDKRVVNSLLYMVESMELGEEKAFQNMSERRKAENE